MIHCSRCGHKWLLAIMLAIVLWGVILWGGACYLLDYALCPQRPADGIEKSWARQYHDYPGMRAWHDSLERGHALREVFMTAPDGVRLHAYYVRSSHPTRHVALLVHGYTDNAVDMMMLGRMYERELGFHVLLPDLRYAGKSEGSSIQMGWLDRLDVKRWVSVLPQLFGDSLEVVVHGISMGAATTMMLSGEPDLPDCVFAFVEDCGYESVEAQFRKEIREQFHLPAFPLVDVASWLCDLRYGWNFREASALEAVARCRRPMLFIHGDTDDYVPTAMVYPLYAAHPGTEAAGDKMLWVVKGAGHAQAYRIHPDAYRRKVAAFLKLAAP